MQSSTEKIRALKPIASTTLARVTAKAAATFAIAKHSDADSRGLHMTAARQGMLRLRYSEIFGMPAPAGRHDQVADWYRIEIGRQRDLGRVDSRRSRYREARYCTQCGRPIDRDEKRWEGCAGCNRR